MRSKWVFLVPIFLVLVVPLSSAATPINYVVEAGLPQGTAFEMVIQTSTFIQVTNGTWYFQSGINSSDIFVIPPTGYNYTSSQSGDVLYLNFTTDNTTQQTQPALVPYLVVGTVLFGLLGLVTALYRRKR